MKILLILGKTLEKQKLNFSRSALLRMKTEVSLKYFVNNCRLRTLNFKCHIYYFKEIYGSKTVCCCGTTLQRKRLMQQGTGKQQPS